MRRVFNLQRDPDSGDLYAIGKSDRPYAFDEVCAFERAAATGDLRAAVAIDQVVGNWYVSTHPDSPFMGQLRVARTGPGWRRTLGSGGVALHRTGLASERWPLADADAVIAELQQDFGIRVPAHPGLHAAIEAWLGSGASSSA